MEMDISNSEKEHVSAAMKITSSGKQKGSPELPLKYDEFAIEETYQLQARKSIAAKSSQMQEQNGELQASQTAPNTIILVQSSIKLNAENAKDGLPHLRKDHASMGSKTAEHKTTEILFSSPTLTTGAIPTASSPRQQTRNEEVIASPLSLDSTQEQSLNDPTIMEKNSDPMISKAQQGTSSKEQTFKSSKAGSTAHFSQKYKGKENAYEEGMVTKSNSSTHSYDKTIGTSEAITSKCFLSWIQRTRLS